MMGNWISPQAHVMTHIRMAQRLNKSRFFLYRKFAPLVRYRLARSWGVYIHPNATIGNVWFAHPTGVVIGAGAVVEDEVTIYQGVTLGARDSVEGAYPSVRRGSVIYAGVTVIGGVTIGPNATIGANSVVLADVPPGCTAVGIPARTIQRGPM